MFQALSGRVSVGKEDKDMSSRRFGTNRYSLIIEITATPTKQTPGTRANRYNLPIHPGLRVCTCKPCVQRCPSASRAEQREPRDPGEEQAKSEEKSNRDNPTFKNRRNLVNPNDITFSNRNKNTLSRSPSFRHPSSLTGDKLGDGPERNPKHSGGRKWRRRAG
jgi:hypothetical protein